MSRTGGQAARENTMYDVNHLQEKHAEAMLQLSKDQEKSARKLQHQLQQIDEAFGKLSEALTTSLETSNPSNIKRPRIGGFFSQLRGLFL